MSAFPISYDATSHVIRLDGSGGVSVMLGLLLKAKFGEAFDPEVLFNAPVARLMSELKANSLTPADGGADRFTPETLHIISNAILHESFRSAWWAMSAAERAAYVREVMAAPHPISDEQIEAVLEGVADGLVRLRGVVEAADRAAAG